MTSTHEHGAATSWRLCARTRSAAHLRRVADYRRPTWPSAETPEQSHVEWMVDDLDHAVAVLQDLGVVEAGYQNPNDPELRVMLDPARHHRCPVTTRSVMPAFAQTRGPGSAVSGRWSTRRP